MQRYTSVPGAIVQSRPITSNGSVGVASPPHAAAITIAIAIVNRLPIDYLHAVPQ